MHNKSTETLVTYGEMNIHVHLDGILIMHTIVHSRFVIIMEVNYVMHMYTYIHVYTLCVHKCFSKTL